MKSTLPRNTLLLLRSSRYFPLYSSFRTLSSCDKPAEHALTNSRDSTFSSNDGAARDALHAAGITKLLCANRGEIACRVLKTAERLGLQTVAVFSDADRGARHAQLAHEACHIGGAAAKDSYLASHKNLEVALRTGAQAVHPGYGFLSENADFADACREAGITFVGPPASAIRSMGDKALAKATMADAGVPVVPGYYGSDQSDERFAAEAERVGYPILVKAAFGGGGRGMKLAATSRDLPEALASARREAVSAFGDGTLLIERYISKPRHVEVQVLADNHGNTASFLDRDCSVQRRHQKIIEEAPAPGLSPAYHDLLGSTAVRAAQAAGYTNAGTVEFILDNSGPTSDGPPFYFMEMNTRLQVEHPVTEAVTGVDLVALQLLVAAGGRLPVREQQQAHGHAFEARLYAESPAKQFLPGAGTVQRWRPPSQCSEFQPPSSSSGEGGLPAVRVDSGIVDGDAVGLTYDGLIAKLITHGQDRETALAGLCKALAQTQVAGLPTNLQFLQRLSEHSAFVSAMDLDTGFLAHHLPDLLAPAPVSVEVASLAAVARHLLKVQVHASAHPAHTLGAWSILDSKRLWHTATKTYADMRLPQETTLTSSRQHSEPSGTAASQSDSRDGSQGGTSTKVDGLHVSLKICGTDSFGVKVKGMVREKDKGGSSDVSSSSGSESEGHVSVTHACLSAAEAEPAGQAAGVSRSEGCWRMQAEMDGRRMHADVIQFTQDQDVVLCMWVDGHPFSYEFRWTIPVWSKAIDAAASAALAPGAAGGKVIAPMSGRVTKVFQQEGDQVSIGQGLLALEAMKMEHLVVAPRDGIVRGVDVMQGQQVSDGRVLMWIEEGSPDAADEQ